MVCTDTRVRQSVNILPDSRARGHGGGVSMGIAGTWIPVFCANCGADGGHCPEENMSFLFYLCNKCAETYGTIANTMFMPDEVFWKLLTAEQLEQYGRYLTIHELEQVIEDEKNSLTKLIRSKH